MSEGVSPSPQGASSAGHKQHVVGGLTIAVLALALLWGTFFIGAIIAMLVAVPLGLMCAIYLTQYAPPRVRAWLERVASQPGHVPIGA
mgnify:CR=1 FL=1